jgi:hypothetical protein
MARIIVQRGTTVLGPLAKIRRGAFAALSRLAVASGRAAWRDQRARSAHSSPGASPNAARISAVT